MNSIFQWVIVYSFVVQTFLLNHAEAQKGTSTPAVAEKACKVLSPNKRTAPFSGVINNPYWDEVLRRRDNMPEGQRSTLTVLGVYENPTASPRQEARIRAQIADLEKQLQEVSERIRGRQGNLVENVDNRNAIMRELTEGELPFALLRAMGIAHIDFLVAGTYRNILILPDSRTQIGRLAKSLYGLHDILVFLHNLEDVRNAPTYESLRRITFISLDSFLGGYIDWDFINLWMESLQPSQSETVQLQ